MRIKVRKAIILRAGCKILDDSVGIKSRRVYYALVVACQFFFSQKKFCKKRVTAVIGMLHNIKITFTFSSRLVIGMLYMYDASDKQVLP